MDYQISTFEVIMPIPPDWDTGQARQLYYGSLIPAIRHEIESSGGTLTLHHMRETQLHYDLDIYKHLLSTHNPSSIIVPRVTKNAEVADFLNNANVPFVIFGHADNSTYPWVDVDNTQAIRMATEQAIKVGHRNIAFLNGPREMSYARLRERGFCDAMAQAHLSVDDQKMLYGNPTVAQGMSMTAHLFQQIDPPTCLICATDDLAIGAAATLEQYGLTVGSDVSITGYGHTLAAQQHSPSIATLQISHESLGAALGKTASRLAKGEGGNTDLLMPAQWQSGLSLQPVSALGNKHIDYNRDPMVLALESTLRRFKRVQVIASVGSWKWSHEDQSFSFSSELRRMLGLDHKGLVSWQAFLEMLAPESRQSFREAWDAGLNGQGVDTRILVHVNEMHYHIHWLGDMVLNACGDRVIAEGSAQDITDLVGLENQLRLAQQEAMSANQFKTSLLNNVTHELRTPLHAVLGLTSRLSSMGVSDEQQVLIDNVVRSGNQLSQTIDDLLMVSKVENQPITIEHHAFDLRAVFERLDGIAHGLLSGRDIHWHIAPPDPSICALKGDAFRFLQIMTNLVGNAAKFTEQGSIEVSVSFEAHHQDESWVQLTFAVKDTGVGISEENKLGLFETFRQEDSSIARNYGGSGLGLSIVKYLVDLMDGHVAVESTKFRGSVFTVTLPFELDKDSDQLYTDEVVTSFEQLFENKRVLIVDDSEINLELARGMTEDLGVEADVALTGSAALDLLKAKDGAYDLVLMDLQMPVMDGLQTTRVIKQQKRFSNIPIIAVTADVTDEQYKEALAVGMVDFLAKPFSQEQLATMMRAIFEQHIE